MACITSTLVAFAQEQSDSARLPENASAHAEIIFDRILNVFGWDHYGLDTTVLREKGTQTLRFSLSRQGTRCRQTRILPCVINCKHSCDKIEYVVHSDGLWDKGLKLCKKDFIAYLLNLSRFMVCKAQMDVEGADGIPTTVSETAENTQVEIDTAEEYTQECVTVYDNIASISTTEKTHEFETLLNRWVPLDRLEVTDTSKANVVNYRLPYDLHKIACVANTLPFEQFMYSELECEMLFKPNSNKFQAGRLMVSILPCPIGLHSHYSDNWSQAVQRQHGFIDVAGTTALHMSIPFNYHRTFVRNLEHGQNAAGVTGGVYVRVEVWIVSPLNVATGQDKDLYVLPFVKFTKAKFAGMAYRIPIAQGPIIQPLLQGPRSFLNVIEGIDQVFTRLENITGLDKPTDVLGAVTVVPTPRMCFNNGKGKSDAHVLKLDPSGRTSMPSRCSSAITLNSVLDIARQWGFLANFMWEKTSKKDTILWNVPLDPSLFRTPIKAKSISASVPSPLTAIARMYQLWTGTLELRLEFVGTSFHSGSVVVAIEFGRTSTATDPCQTYSTYTQVVDVGESRVAEITIPYIFDTPWRRTNNVPLFGNYAIVDQDKVNKYRAGVLFKVNTRIIVRVANVLKAPDTVAPSMNVLAYIRAGPDFRVMGLIQNNGILRTATNLLDFPSDHYQPILKPRAKRETTSVTTKYHDNIVKKQKDHADLTLGDIFAAMTTTTSTNAEIIQLQAKIAEFEKMKGSTATVCTPDDDMRNMQAKLQHQDYYMEQYVNHFKAKGVDDAHTLDKVAREIRKGNHANQPTVIVGTEYLVQSAVSFSVAVGSPMYDALFQAFALLPQWRWVAMPAAQIGDTMTKTQHQFSPNRQEPIHTLTTSVEDSLWDIFCRPVLICSDYKITTSKTGKLFYVPLMPPQWVHIDKTGDPDFPCVFTSQSPHVALLSQFRFWRGTMRYTFVVKKGRDPIYITYIPKSGARIFGERDVFQGGEGVTQFKKIIPAASGNATEILIPSVNPTAHVEVPYIQENVWSLLNQDHDDATIGWRDQVDDNVGHLVLQTTHEVTLDIFWAGGDDFRVAGYIGNIEQLPLRAIDTLNDDWPRAQMMGFHACEVLGNLPGVSQLCDAASSISWSGLVNALPSIYTSYRVNNMLDSVQGLPPKIDELVVTMTNTALMAQDKMLATGNMFGALEEALKSISAKFALTGPGLIPSVSKATQYVVDIWVAWQSWDPTVLAGTLVRWFIDLGLFTYSHLGPAMDLFTQIFRFSTTVKAQSWQDDLWNIALAMVNLFVTVFSMKVSFQYMRGEMTTWTRLLCGDFSHLFRNLNQSWLGFVNFLKGFIQMIQKLWYHMVGTSDPSIKLYYLLTSENKKMKQLVKDMIRAQTEENRRALPISPMSRLKFYALTKTAIDMKALIASSTEIKVSPHLVNVLDKMIKTSNEVSTLLSTAPVRFEPFVICLEGESGIGKSYMATSLATHLLKTVGWVGGDPIFVRTPGKTFWDGYVDQPVILFDDMNNIDSPEVVVQVLTDIFALKSSALFTPNMARIEEKERRANPLIVIQLTNTPFPKMDEAAHRPAVDRRRDIMYKVSIPSNRTKPDELDSDPTYDHLQFQAYESVVRDPVTGSGVCSDIAVSYDIFMEQVTTAWKKYHTREIKNVQYRTKQVMKCMESSDVGDLINDPYIAITGCLYGMTQGDTKMTGRALEDLDVAYERIWKRLKCETPYDIALNECLETETRVETLRAQSDGFEERWGVIALQQKLPRLRLDVGFLFSNKFLDIVFKHHDLELNTCSRCNTFTTLILKSCEHVKLCGFCTGEPCPLSCDKTVSMDLYMVYQNLIQSLKIIAEKNGMKITEVFWVWATLLHSRVSNPNNIHPTITLWRLVFYHITQDLSTYVHCLQVGTTLPPDNALHEIIYLKQASSRKVTASNTDYNSILNSAASCTYPKVNGKPYNVDTSLLPEVPQWDMDSIPVYTIKLPYTQETCRHLELFTCISSLELTKSRLRKDQQAEFEGNLYTPREEALFMEGKWRCDKKAYSAHPCDEHCPFIKPDMIKMLINEQVLDTVEGMNGLWLCYRNDEPSLDYPPQVWSERALMQSIVIATPDSQTGWTKRLMTWLDSFSEGVWWQGKFKAFRDISSITICLGAICATATACWLLWAKFQSAYGWIRSFFGTGGDNNVQPPPSDEGTGEAEEFCEEINEEINSQISQAYDAEVRRFQRRQHRVNKVSTRAGQVVRPQGQLDNSIDAIASIIYNIICMEISFGSGNVRKLYMLGIAGNVCLAPRHYIEQLNEWAKARPEIALYRMVQPDVKRPYAFHLADFTIDVSNDLMVFRAPPNVALLKDIRKHFCSRKYYEENHITKQGFIVAPPVGRLQVPIAHHINLHERVTQSRVLGPDNNTYYDIFNAVTYNWSQPGACGSPVFRLSAVEPLLGIHVAGKGEGSTGVGYALIITREDLDVLVGPVAQMSYEVPPLLPTVDALVSLEGMTLEQLGAIDRKKIVRQPDKTKICLSAISPHLQVPITKVPMPLNAKDPPYDVTDTSPLIEGVRHHGELQKDIDTGTTEYIGEFIDTMLSTMEPLVLSPQVLTPEQAVVGFEEETYYDCLDLTTSAGWPWCVEAPVTDKTPWINVERDEQGAMVAAKIDDRVLSVITEKDKLRATNTIPFTVFVDYLKDEKKKKTSAQQIGKTRIFCMSPLDFTISTRMYYLHFMAAFMKRRLDLPHAVGINPDSWEWAKMVSNLQEVNADHIFTIDYTNFGPAFNARACVVALQAMTKWTEHNCYLSDDEIRCLHVINWELIHSTHLCMDVVYKQTCGSPSGAAITVVINSLVNWFYILMAYKYLVVKDVNIGSDFSKLVHSADNLGLSSIKKNVYFVVYGDDVVAAARPQLLPIFNAKTITEFFSKYDIAATDASKGNEVIPYTTYDQFEFLKRGVLEHPYQYGMYLAPMNWDSITDTAHYVWSDTPSDQATRVNAAASLLLSYGHGPDKFKQWRETLNSALCKAGLQELTLSWDDLDRMFFPVKGQAEPLVIKTQLDSLTHEFYLLLGEEHPDDIWKLQKRVEEHYVGEDRYLTDLLTADNAAVLPVSPLKRRDIQPTSAIKYIDSLPTTISVIEPHIDEKVVLPHPHEEDETQAQGTSTGGLALPQNEKKLIDSATCFPGHLVPGHDVRPLTLRPYVDNAKVNRLGFYKVRSQQDLEDVRIREEKLKRIVPHWEIKK